MVDLPRLIPPFQYHLLVAGVVLLPWYQQYAAWVLVTVRMWIGERVTTVTEQGVWSGRVVGLETAQ